ncbi:damage-inducible protein DinB [Alicyclobacillus tengchongensis]|nr:damage-inducible protein DinB [Alicyclobacillus tengchongensis]
MHHLLKQQYDLIRSTREALFVFLESIPLRDLQAPVSGFGSGSIIKTYIHVADCYLYWLGAFALRQHDFSFASDHEVTNSDVQRVRDRFELVNETVDHFLQVYHSKWDAHVQNHVRWQETPKTTTPLWLLTHTETHEFHHKGQIVAMARQLGYVPPDTDLVLG